MSEDPAYEAKRDIVRDLFELYKKALGNHKRLLVNAYTLLQETHPRLGLFEPLEFYSERIPDLIKSCDAMRPGVESSSPDYIRAQRETCNKRGAALEGIEAAITSYEGWVQAVQDRGKNEPAYRDISLLLWPVRNAWNAYLEYMHAHNDLIRYLCDK
jgi:hypothetical protein